MNRFPIIAIIYSTALFGVAEAAPRIALVRVKEIYTEMPSTLALAEQIKAEREQIDKNQRAIELRRIFEELQNIQTRLSDKKKPLSEEAGKKLARTYEIKLQEAKTFQQEYENFRSEQEKIISRKEVAAMRATLNQIMEVTQRISKERGFELVMDNTGGTNTGLPFVLYQKNSVDLTNDVKAAIKDIKPAAAKPVAEPKTTSKP